MKKISDFTGFQCSASALDQIKGGQGNKVLEESVYTGCGLDGETGRTIYDMTLVYTDDTWTTVYFFVQ